MRFPDASNENRRNRRMRRRTSATPTAPGSRKMAMTLHHHTQPLRRARNAGVEPSGAAVLECKALVEQHHVVPLRALRFVHGEHIAVIELVIGLALLPRDGLDGAAETLAADR